MRSASFLFWVILLDLLMYNLAVLSLQLVAVHVIAHIRNKGMITHHVAGLPTLRIIDVEPRVFVTPKANLQRSTPKQRPVREESRVRQG
jgi:hypothetical protein